MVDKRTLQECLAQLEDKSGQMAEHDVSTAVRALRQKNNQGEPPMEWLAEAMAFDFCENYRNKDTGWGTYFGPMMVMPDESGQMIESPSIRRVTAEMLDYWTKRAKESKHPILRARYAGLVWDFTKEVTGQAAGVEIAHIRIDSIVEIAASNCHKYETDVITKLEHALYLAIRLNDTFRIARVRDAILEYEDKVAEDDKPGLWGFSFDLLWKNKKANLTDDQKSKIISDLEERLGNVSDLSGDGAIDPWAAEAAAVRLAKHYRVLNRPEEIKRVLTKYGAAFEKMAEPAAAMLASAWMQQVHRVYQEFGLRDEANRILTKIRKLGPKVNDDLKPISAEFSITKKEMNQYVEAMIEGDLERALQRVVVKYIPRRDETEKQIKDLSSKAVMTFLFTKQLQDHKGRPIATIGSLENDLDGHVISQTAQNMQISAIFLRQVMTALIDKFSLTSDHVLDYVYESPLFEDDKKGIIARGLKAYFDNEALVAIHLLIPQIEDAIRNLVEYMGGTILKPGRNGGLYLKTFDELLRDTRVTDALSSDVALYFRILFTDPRGVNLRNNVCHGISPADSLGIGLADRVLHAMLILAQVREKAAN